MIWHYLISLDLIFCSVSHFSHIVSFSSGNMLPLCLAIWVSKHVKEHAEIGQYVEYVLVFLKCKILHWYFACLGVFCSLFWQTNWVFCMKIPLDAFLLVSVCACSRVCVPELRTPLARELDVELSLEPSVWSRKDLVASIAGRNSSVRLCWRIDLAAGTGLLLHQAARGEGVRAAQFSVKFMGWRKKQKYSETSPNLLDSRLLLSCTYMMINISHDICTRSHSGGGRVRWVRLCLLAFKSLGP